MKYHDILGVSVFDGEEKIQLAYEKKKEKLSCDVICPELYKSKLKEIGEARKQCLEYHKLSFNQKFKAEAVDMQKTAFSPTTLNSCCCSDCCSTMCTVAFCGIILGLGIHFVSGLLDDVKKEEEETRRKNEIEASRRLAEQRTANAVNASKKKREKEIEIGNLSSECDSAEKIYQKAENDHSVFLVRVKNFSQTMGFGITEKELTGSVMINEYRKQVMEYNKDFSILKNKLSKAREELREAEEILKSLN